MLYLFRERYSAAYQRIVATVRQMVPDFCDFVLEPNKLNDKQISLRWTHRGHDYEFGPHQLSDGSLRFIALATLLLQPPDFMPLLIALDEPELGLHPAALEVLGGMIERASTQCQVVLATQSVNLLDCFSPGAVVVAHCRDGETAFERLTEDALVEWRQDSGMGDIWLRHVVGGGPYE
jgi:predicted ATPase